MPLSAVHSQCILEIKFIGQFVQMSKGMGSTIYKTSWNDGKNGFSNDAFSVIYAGFVVYDSNSMWLSDSCLSFSDKALFCSLCKICCLRFKLYVTQRQLSLFRHITFPINVKSAGVLIEYTGNNRVY